MKVSAELRMRVLNLLRRLQKSGDVESAHYLADQTLCLVLEYLGHTDIVEEYEKIKKTYS